MFVTGGASPAGVLKRKTVRCAVQGLGSCCEMPSRSNRSPRSAASAAPAPVTSSYTIIPTLRVSR